MKVIELFCGTKSFSKEAEKVGFSTLTIDNNPKYLPDICTDLLYFNKKMLPKEWRNPDVVWCSPPCETFSLSGNSYYFGYPVNSRAYVGLALVYKCLELIRELRPKYWVIENPRAGLRSVWFMKPLEKTTVTYCQYGDTRMKPTDIWNNFGYVGKSCKNGDNCHTPAPRGSNTGTQGEKSKEDRYKVPDLLCRDILNEIKKQR